jgi:hypothetical protein
VGNCGGVYVWPLTRYGGAVDVEHATDLCTQGRSLRHIGADLQLSTARAVDIGRDSVGRTAESADWS